MGAKGMGAKGMGAKGMGAKGMGAKGMGAEFRNNAPKPQGLLKRTASTRRKFKGCKHKPGA
jgi:hypothetical protein